MKKYKPKDILELVDEFMTSNYYSMLLTFEEGEIGDITALRKQVRAVIPEEYITCCQRGKNKIWFEKADWKRKVKE